MKTVDWRMTEPHPVGEEYSGEIQNEDEDDSRKRDEEHVGKSQFAEIQRRIYARPCTLLEGRVLIPFKVFLMVQIF